jgi:hypothetical protein
MHVRWHCHTRLTPSAHLHFKRAKFFEINDMRSLQEG